METNRRRFARIHFSTPGCLAFRVGEEEQECAVEILDLSLKGALIRRAPLVADLRIGMRGALEVGLGDASHDPDIYMSIEVAHVREEEIGLRCTEIDIDSITQLRRLVELNLGDEALLSRELENLTQA
jgi:hypothetical protein